MQQTFQRESQVCGLPRKHQICTLVCYLVHGMLTANDGHDVVAWLSDY